MNVLRHLKHRKFRTSSASSLQASAAIPNSGFIFVDNAQGASAAVSELSKTLDSALDNVEFGENFRDLLQSQLDRLDEKAEEYVDSSLAGCKTKTEWTCSQSEAEFIDIAWKCSLAVYNPTCTIQSETIDFKVQDCFLPSASGTTKAVSFTLVNTTAPATKSKSFFPVLVVAVRGTASTVDGMVNANNSARDASKLFGDSEPNPLLQSCKEAHAGFLHAAIALKATVFKHVDDSNRNDHINHVLFTGHSAGGAVASLLCLSYQAHSQQNNSPIRSSCITFGSPPTACPQPTTKSSPIDDQGLWINIVNEYDLVTRVDQSYVRSLVDLYRLVYGLPPIEDTTIQNEALTTSTNDSGSSSNVDNAKVSAYASGRAWVFPAPNFQHIGEMVVLQLGRVARNKQAEDASAMKDEVVLTAWKVPHQDFIKLLFCRVTVHSRKPYQERIDMIASGCFNGREGWF